MLSLTVILRLLCISILLNYSYVCVVFYKNFLKNKKKSREIDEEPVNEENKTCERATRISLEERPGGFHPGGQNRVRELQQFWCLVILHSDPS